MGLIVAVLIGIIGVLLGVKIVLKGIYLIGNGFGTIVAAVMKGGK